MPAQVPRFMIARQYGFTTGAGSILNVVDGDPATFYQPLGTDFGTYTDQFFAPDGSLNYGKPFPAIEFLGAMNDHDPAVDMHIEQFVPNLERLLTLGDCIIIGSQNEASSVSNTLQTGDVFLGQFTGKQLHDGGVLKLTIDKDATFKFYRLLQRTTDPAHAPPPPGVGTNFIIFDTPGAHDFTVPTYSGKFIAEYWGGGATGGENATGVDGTATTHSAWSISAGGGHHATQTNPNVDAAGATGGTATGGNTLNIDGGAGGPPIPASVGIGVSGRGGDCPHGGAGGDPVVNAGVLGGLYYGDNGKAPGGGGSGRNIFASSSGGSAFKYPGGGSGGYSRHELTFGVDGPGIGDVLSFIVGAGGQATAPNLNGSGANGRVKFSWT